MKIHVVSDQFIKPRVKSAENKLFAYFLLVDEYFPIDAAVFLTKTNKIHFVSDLCSGQLERTQTNATAR
jgi:hypothetical protein